MKWKEVFKDMVYVQHAAVREEYLLDGTVKTVVRLISSFALMHDPFSVAKFLFDAVWNF